MEDKNKRRSLTIRCQPSASNPLANVADWLNSMESREKRDKVEQVCLMTFLPYALEFNGKTEEEIERCYWEVHERLHQYLFVMRQTLGVKGTIDSRLYSGINVGVDSSEEQTAPEEQNELPSASLSDIDLIFGA